MPLEDFLLSFGLVLLVGSMIMSWLTLVLPFIAMFMTGGIVFISGIVIDITRLRIRQ